MIPRVVICILFLVQDFQKLFLIGFGGVAAMLGACRVPVRIRLPERRRTSSIQARHQSSEDALRRPWRARPRY